MLEYMSESESPSESESLSVRSSGMGEPDVYTFSGCSAGESRVMSGWLLREKTLAYHWWGAAVDGGRVGLPAGTDEVRWWDGLANSHVRKAAILLSTGTYHGAMNGARGLMARFRPRGWDCARRSSGWGED